MTETTDIENKELAADPITEPTTVTSVETPAAAPAIESTSGNSPVEPPVAAEKPTAVTLGPAVSSSNAKYLHFAVEAILLIAVVVLGSNLASAKSDNKNLQTQLASVQSNPQALVQKQSDDLIAKVGSLMKLPAGETPTVAAVSDAAAAKQQSPFFANAANGDKVLLYVKAGEAILYRPSTNKIILVAPLTFNDAAATATTKK